MEGRAAADFAFGPEAAVVSFDDAMDDGEADAGAFEFVGGVEALKDAEEFGGVAHIEAGAVVGDRVDDLGGGLSGGDADGGGVAFGGEFEGV